MFTPALIEKELCLASNSEFFRGEIKSGFNSTSIQSLLFKSMPAPITAPKLNFE